MIVGRRGEVSKLPPHNFFECCQNRTVACLQIMVTEVATNQLVHLYTPIKQVCITVSFLLNFQVMDGFKNAEFCIL